MSKKDYYIIEKNINKVIRGESTNFLDQNISKQVLSKLKGYNYNVYYPYQDSEKVIIYSQEVPKIKVLEIISYDTLTHREILGSLFGLNISSELFGDIIITNNHYFIMIIDSIYELIKNEYNMVGYHHIKIKEVPIEVISNYKRVYQEIEFIVTSLRIDTVISRLIGTSRENIKKYFNEDSIILNYEVCHKINNNLIENDIFSIKKHGKYKFIGIVKESKKGNYIIKCLKYIDK